MTPTANVGPGSNSPASQVVHRPGKPDMIKITAADIRRAHQFRLLGKREYMPTIMHAKNIGNMQRPNAITYPFDMTNYGGPTMPSVTAYNVYISVDGTHCVDESCWGTPEEFLKGIAGSTFVNLINQYTGGAAAGYTYGDSVSVTVPMTFTNTFYDEELFAALSAAANHFQAAGPTVMYHLFLPPGIDTCFDQTSICYSPDNLSSFYFCAYHTAVGVPGTSPPVPLIFSVEPWQNAKVQIGSQSFFACQNSKVPKGTNRLNSGTASTLSHESFEAWSDPIPNTGWFNAFGGGEIGDFCAYIAMFQGKFGGATYYLQQEWSNMVHGCNAK